jgi:hypothetical protein
MRSSLLLPPVHRGRAIREKKREKKRERKKPAAIRAANGSTRMVASSRIAMVGVVWMK